MLLSVLWIWLLSMVLGAWNQYVINPAIIGGNQAKEGRFRFLAAVFRNGHYSECGGSLITRRHVLTAKHCVERGNWTEYEVIIGMYDRYIRSPYEQRVQVSQLIGHKEIDASIVVLAANVTLNENASVIELAMNQEPVGSWATAMGWGRTQHSNAGTVARFLKTVDVPIANSSVCNVYGSSYLVPVMDHEICCGDPSFGEYVGACHGDSGSPLVYPANSTEDSEVRQIGITARGVPQCPQGAVYSVFVSVPAIYIWILCQSNMLDGRNFTDGDVNCSIYEDSQTSTAKVQTTTAESVRSSVSDWMSSETKAHFSTEQTQKISQDVVTLFPTTSTANITKAPGNSEMSTQDIRQARTSNLDPQYGYLGFLALIPAAGAAGTGLWYHMKQSYKRNREDKTEMSSVHVISGGNKSPPKKLTI